MKATSIDDEAANIVIIKVKDYFNHRYDRHGRSGMRLIVTYTDPDARTISFRGTGMYKVHFSHFDLARYIAKGSLRPFIIR